MSEDLNQNTEQESTDVVPDQLETLKARASTMGIKFHPSISIEKLREKISAKLNDQPDPEDPVMEIAPTKVDVEKSAPAPSVPALSEAQIAANKRRRISDDARKLVRVTIACNNPAKKEWEGEIFTTGNNVIGTLKKYVPFNVEWHVPQMILTMIRNRECQTFQWQTMANGAKVRKSRIIKEFNVEVLDPLTKEELAELERRQAMAGSID
jgi:hypothetical protein